MKIKIISNHLINLCNILLKLITCTMIIDTHTRLKVIYWNIIKMGNRYSAYVSPFLKHEFCFNDVCIIRFHILIPQSQGLSWHNRLNYFFLPLVISNIYLCNMSIQEFSQILIWECYLIIERVYLYFTLCFLKLQCRIRERY